MESTHILLNSNPRPRGNAKIHRLVFRNNFYWPAVIARYLILTLPP